MKTKDTFLALLLGASCLFCGCIQSELLVEVFGLGSDIDGLEVHLATARRADLDKWAVSKAIRLNDVQPAIARMGGRYRLTLNHSLAVSEPSLARVSVAALSMNCLRGVGSAEGELMDNNRGYSTIEVVVAAQKPPGEPSPCGPAQPVVTGLEFTRKSPNETEVVTSGFVYGWGFREGSQVLLDVALVPAQPPQPHPFLPVKRTVSATQYLPDRLRFSLAELSNLELLTLHAPSNALSFVELDKKVQVQNPGTPASLSNVFHFE